MRPIVTANVKYTEIVETGFVGGAVLPNNFTPTPEGFQALKANILKSGQLGRLVSSDFAGVAVTAKLIDSDCGLAASNRCW